MKIKLSAIIITILFCISGLIAWCAETAPSCPRCHSNNSVIPILYGLPIQSAEEVAKEGKIWLGGCIPHKEQWHCKKCGIEFGSDGQPIRIDKVEKATLANTPASVLADLAKDPDVIVRRLVANNPNTSIADLTKLAEDTDSYVRAGVAYNSKTSTADLTKLAEESEWYVRESVARNPSTPGAILRHLTTDPVKSVREAAQAAAKAKVFH